MKFFSLLACIACVTSSPAAEPVSLRVATVDIQALFKDYDRTREAQEQINVERARIQKQNNERLARIREIDDQLGILRKQLNDPTMSASRKQVIYQEWQTKQQEGIGFDRERREFLERRNRALNEKMVQRMRGILEEIRKLVVEEAKKENLGFVFDRSGLSTSQLPVVLYAKDSYDLTGKVLKRLNKASKQAGKCKESELAGAPQKQ